MSLSFTFVFPEHQSMTSVGRQIGDAVPPRMAEAIAAALARCLEAAGAATDDHALLDGAQTRLTSAAGHLN